MSLVVDLENRQVFINWKQLFQLSSLPTVPCEVGVAGVRRVPNAVLHLTDDYAYVILVVMTTSASAAGANGSCEILLKLGAWHLAAWRKFCFKQFGKSRPQLKSNLNAHT